MGTITEIPKRVVLFLVVDYQNQEENKTEEVAALIHSNPHVCGHWIDLHLFKSCSMVDCCEPCCSKVKKMY